MTMMRLWRRTKIQIEFSIDATVFVMTKSKSRVTKAHLKEPVIFLMEGASAIEAMCTMKKNTRDAETNG